MSSWAGYRVQYKTSNKYIAPKNNPAPKNIIIPVNNATLINNNTPINNTVTIRNITPINNTIPITTPINNTVPITTPINNNPTLQSITSIDTAITFIIIENDNINKIVTNLLEQTNNNWICIIIKLSNNYDDILKSLDKKFKIIDFTNEVSKQDMSFYQNYVTHFVYTDYVVYIDVNTIIEKSAILRLKEMIKIYPNIDAFFLKSAFTNNDIVCYKLFNFYSNIKYKTNNFQSYLISNGLTTLNI
jgi:hypothetical protein